MACGIINKIVTQHFLVKARVYTEKIRVTRGIFHSICIPLKSAAYLVCTNKSSILLMIPVIKNCVKTAVVNFVLVLDQACWRCKVGQLLACGYLTITDNTLQTGVEVLVTKKLLKN